MSVYIGSRDVVTVSGDDAASYLQGQISQDVMTLAVGESAWSLILQPQGKVDAWFRITKQSENTFLLDVDAGYGEALQARVKRFMMRVKVELALETWQWHAIRGDATPANAPESAIAAPPAKGQSGLDLLDSTLPDPAESPMSEGEFERLRIEAMVPRMGAELTDSTIPAEAGIVDESASFTKGCYTGQELVARVDSRGSNTPRRLRLIRGTGSAPTATDLTRDGASAGVVTSVADADDGWVGLAYIKRSALDAETLELAGAEVRVDIPATTP